MPISWELACIQVTYNWRAITVSKGESVRVGSTQNLVIASAHINGEGPFVSQESLCQRNRLLKPPEADPVPASIFTAQPLIGQQGVCESSHCVMRCLRAICHPQWSRCEDRPRLISVSPRTQNATVGFPRSFLSIAMPGSRGECRGQIVNLFFQRKLDMVFIRRNQNRLLWL